MLGIREGKMKRSAKKILRALFVLCILLVAAFALLLLFDPNFGAVGSCPNYPYCDDQ
mgnify:CR=1 FL=1